MISVNYRAQKCDDRTAIVNGDREAMAEYRAELKMLAEKVMEVMEENLGLRKGYITEALDGPDRAFFGTKVCPIVLLP